MKSDPKNTLYCYLRVSSQEQVDEGHSIERQRSVGKQLSDRMGFEYVELNEGGTSSMRKDRPELGYLLQLIREGECKHLWYLNRSRWTRNQIEDLTIKNKYLKPFKVKVYEGENGEQRRYSDPSEEFVDNILTSVQELDRLQRRQISVNGKRHLSRVYGDKAIFLGGTPRFGYQTIEKKWVVEKDESRYLKKIFQFYLQGKSLKWIKNYLDGEGVSPRRGKSWNLGTLNTMLRNEGYTGHYKWRDKETNEDFTIIIPQVISHSLFNKVQKVIKNNQKNKGNNVRKHPSLLSDFMTCSCGQNIGGHVTKGTRKNGTKLNSKVYTCSSRNQHWKGKLVNECNNRRSLNMDKTDEFVINKIKDIIGNSSLLKEKFKKDILNKKSIETDELRKSRTKLERRVKTLDTQIDTTINSISKVEVNNMLGKIDNRIYQSMIKSLNEELESLEDNRKISIKKIDDLDSRKDWIDWVSKYGDEISDNLERNTNETLKGLVKNIIVYPVMGPNRDGITKQIGHKLKVTFELPIVNDKLVWDSKTEKSSGYSIETGKSTYETNTIQINTGGRPKKKV